MSVHGLVCEPQIVLEEVVAVALCVQILWILGARQTLGDAQVIATVFGVILILQQLPLPPQQRQLPLQPEYQYRRKRIQKKIIFLLDSHLHPTVVF